MYGSLPEQKTVLEYLEYQAAPGTNTQQIKDVAGSLLFSGEMVEKKIRVLSGGERARLVLAGLLLEKHNVLVLDEPGAGLDVQARESLWDELRRHTGAGGSIILTTHHLEEVNALAHEVVLLDRGQVRATGPAAQLLAEWS